MAAEAQYLDDLSSEVRSAFGRSLHGLYLTGSMAVGGYRPGRSDIDVIAVVTDASREQLEDVVARCRHEALPCPAPKLELVVYDAEAIAAPGERPGWSLNLNTGECEHHVGFDPDAEPAHWFVLDLAFAHRYAVALAGPPPQTVIGDPGSDITAAAMDEMVAWYEEHEPDGLAAATARAEHWRTTGEWAGKAAFEG